MKQLSSLLLTFVFTISLFGQEKLLTIEEAVIGQWRELYPESMRNIQWQGASNDFTFQDYQTLYQQSVNNNDTTVLLTLSDLNAALKDFNDSVNYIPAINWEDKNNFHFFNQNRWYNYSLKEEKVTSQLILPKEAENKEVFYAKKLIAYTIDNNLFIANHEGNKIALTNDKDENIVNGQSVSRREFGISGGIFWSPEGNYLAYYRKDNSKVRNYPLVDITAREAEVNNIKYPMAGMSSEHISLGVYNLTTEETTFIEREDTVSEKYLTNISWDPNEQFIYIQVLNRDQNHMKMNKYRVDNGELSKTLFQEKHQKYVEPYHKLIFLNKDSDKFIYQSRTNGYNHAFLYNTNGQLINQLTSGKWEITDIIGLDKKDNLYYISTQDSPIERHAYMVNTKNSKSEKLTRIIGTHSLDLNANGKYLIDRYTNTDIPNAIDIISTSGKKIRNVLIASNPLQDYAMPDMEIGTITAADNETELYYRLIKPLDFDPNKKYPAIVYVYGGPHAQLINNQWLGGARMWNYYMAQKGYVMLTVDNRGSANRGLEFENIIHRQCGVNEMKDQMKGIEYLESLGYVDTTRIGVHGWSYGGFMTTSLMVNHNSVFKVGVAGGPVIDWKYYEVMYGERYMDTPEQNPEGYTYTSLIPRAADLKGKLLIIHGAVDPTVVMQHSQLFVRECIKQKVPVDYFIYPRAEHNVRGYDRIHLMDKVTNYFEDYLK